MNRKGIIFSLIAIGLSGLFIVYFTTYYTEPIDNNIKSVETRVRVLDNTIDDMFEFAGDSLKVSGYRSLESLYSVVNRTSPPTYLTNFTKDFVFCARNGTLGNGSSCGNNDNYSVILQSYSDVVWQSLRIRISPSIESFEMVDEDHWSFTLRANISYVLTDEYASWEGWKVVERNVNIDGIKDPAMLQLHHDYSSFPYFSGIRIRPNYVQDVEWTYDRFYKFVQKREYRQSNKGPCLRQRFEGDFDNSSSSCGLETVLNPIYFEKLAYVNNINHTLLDYQLLRNLTFPCEGNATIRVSVLNITNTDEYLFQLTLDDANRFKLFDQIYWVEALNRTTAPGCQGCTIGDCENYGP